MKLRELFYGLGWKPKRKEYSHDLESVSLPRDGLVEFARWRHPTDGRWWDLSQEAIDALREFIQEGDVAIDIGAHTGDTTVPMALAAGPTGTVLALEPNPHVFKVLLANAKLNPSKTNIVPLNFAATEEDGELEFAYGDPAFSNGGHPGVLNRWQRARSFTLTVHGRNLLKYLSEEHPGLQERVRYIKIDVEGADHRVARTLIPLIERCRPYIRTEIFRYSTREAREDYYRFLRDLGYQVHRFESPKQYRGRVLDVSDLMRWRYFDVFAVPE